MAKTKRRKVLVTFHEIGSVTHLTRKAAGRAVALSPIGKATEKAVPFTESRPGDVVLSREDAKWLRMMARASEFESDADKERTLNILRGGR